MNVRSSIGIGAACVAGFLAMASAAGAQTVFGFDAFEVDRPGDKAPWHQQASYTFNSPDGNPAKSVTIEALDFRPSPASPPVLMEGWDDGGSIGVMTAGDKDAKVWLQQGIQIGFGQVVEQVELKFKDLGDLSRQVLWIVSGTDASGRDVLIKGAIAGSGAPDSELQAFVIDQEALAKTPGQPEGGFKGPVAISEITLASLSPDDREPQLGDIRLDQSFYLVEVWASAMD
jgi:hypothetical protein